MFSFVYPEMFYKASRRDPDLWGNSYPAIFDLFLHLKRDRMQCESQ